ncbi:type VI secretion system-associated FHA domain protein [Azospirillum sp. ST 5-10]|uniref:type VI secretion system-associated FHA domain protein n=1 Tax=unclassified Azospirillum TaxID=2630922 RepID=UPI003F49D654
MKLHLSITSYQRALLGGNATKVFGPQGGTIGRAVENDWVLDDTTRTLSGRHAVIAFEAGRFRITDTSTNGVFLNDADEPLGRGASAPLNNGDTLQLGDYALAVKVDYEAAADAAGILPPVNPAELLGRPAPAAPTLILPDEWDPASLLETPRAPLAAPPPPASPPPVAPPAAGPAVAVPRDHPLDPVLARFSPAALRRRWGTDDPAVLWNRYAASYLELVREARSVYNGSPGPGAGSDTAEDVVA